MPMQNWMAAGPDVVRAAGGISAMEHPGFFTRAGPFSLRQVVEAAGAEAPANGNLDTEIVDVKTLDDAGAGHVSFFDNPKYMAVFERTNAAACFVAERFASRAPEATSVLVSVQPYRSFALALALFYPDSLRPATAAGLDDWPDGAGPIHPSAELEENVRVEPGAIVGADARIGAGTRLCAGAIVGARVHIGRNCYIGPNASVTNTLIGDGVILHSGVSVGQDGFGFAMGKEGHLKVPQIGRVIIQDNVEIGANSTVDRGALRDTVIGEGTKIDNLVQIAHNVVIGRNCVIVAQTGISGSTELEDFVVLGGQVGVVGHVRIGAGAQIAGSSSVRTNVPPGEKWGGTPAKQARTWFRELTALKKLAEQSPGKAKDSGKPES